MFENGVTNDMLNGTQAGDVFNGYLRQAYQPGANVAELGKQAAAELAQLGQ